MYNSHFPFFKYSTHTPENKMTVLRDCPKIFTVEHRYQCDDEGSFQTFISSCCYSASRAGQNKTFPECVSMTRKGAAVSNKLRTLNTSTMVIYDPLNDIQFHSQSPGILVVGRRVEGEHTGY